MDNLIAYLYRKYLISNDSGIESLSKGESINISKISEQQLQQYLPLISKNMLVYSNVTIEIKLSMPHILLFLRLHKMENLMKKRGLSDFFTMWIENQFFPFVVEAKKKIPISPLIFADYSEENDKGKDKTIKVMLNISEITKQLLKQTLMQSFEITNASLNIDEQLLRITQKIKWMKFEEYICQKFCQDTLMTLNFIIKYPLIDQKQLVKRTMLKIVDLRKCLNRLVVDGWISFYPQNSRTMLFKAIQKEQILEIFRDIIAKMILNLYLTLQQQKDAESRTQTFIAITQLDSILILF